MSKKTIVIIICCIVFLVLLVLGFIFVPPIVSEYKVVSEEMEKDKSIKERAIEDAKNDFLKNDDAKDTGSYRVEADGTFVNTSGTLYAMHEASYVQVNEMKIRTLKENPKMAEIEARVTNNSDLVISNIGVYITFKFSDGTNSEPIPLPINYIPVGGTITAKTKVLKRVIDAYDYTFMSQSFIGGGAG